jgi:pullulanase/glycogen debranching enzyme
MEYPLGATLHGDGVNFAVYSKHASEVLLLLFDKSDGEPTDIIKKLANRDKFIWHEFARTQRGNNNAYCQDNEIRWLDWTSAARNSDIFDFFRKAIAFTRPFPILQHRKFFLGVDLDDDQVPT